MNLLDTKLVVRQPTKSVPNVGQMIWVSRVATLGVTSVVEATLPWKEGKVTKTLGFIAAFEGSSYPVALGFSQVTSHYTDPYKPINIMEYHKGVELCSSLEILICLQFFKKF